MAVRAGAGHPEGRGDRETGDGGRRARWRPLRRQFVTSSVQSAAAAAGSGGRESVGDPRGTRGSTDPPPSDLTAAAAE